jgi:hypothetical protein
MLLGEHGYHYQNLWAQIYMAYTILRQGDIEKARELFENGIRGMQQAGLVIGLVFAVEGIASLYVNQGKIQGAARLFAWADAMREKIGDPRPPVEQVSVERDLGTVRSQLGNATFADLSEEGQMMTVEEAIAVVLEH